MYISQRWCLLSPLWRTKWDWFTSSWIVYWKKYSLRKRGNVWARDVTIFLVSWMCVCQFSSLQVCNCQPCKKLIWLLRRETIILKSKLKSRSRKDNCKIISWTEGQKRTGFEWNKASLCVTGPNYQVASNIAWGVPWTTSRQWNCTYTDASPLVNVFVDFSHVFEWPFQTNYQPLHAISQLMHSPTARMWEQPTEEGVLRISIISEI